MLYEAVRLRYSLEGIALRDFSQLTSDYYCSGFWFSFEYPPERTIGPFPIL